MGSRLRDWASHFGWALFWVDFGGKMTDDTVFEGNQNHSNDGNGNGIGGGGGGDSRCFDQRRLLDPVVATAPRSTLNVSIGAGALDVVEALWNSTHGLPANQTAQWAQLTNKTLNPHADRLLVWNIGVRDCEDYDRCVGVTTDGECICYKN